MEGVEITRDSVKLVKHRGDGFVVLLSEDADEDSNFFEGELFVGFVHSIQYKYAGRFIQNLKEGFALIDQPRN